MASASFEMKEARPPGPLPAPPLDQDSAGPRPAPGPFAADEDEDRRLQYEARGANCQECSGPCVCSWCGGIMLFWAALGFILYGTVQNWGVGMAMAYCGALGLLCGAQQLSKSEAMGRMQYPLAVSFLYCAGLVFVFVAGLFVPLNVIGESDSDASPGCTPPGCSSSSSAAYFYRPVPSTADRLAASLPGPEPEAKLVEWARCTDGAQAGRSFANVGSHLYFRADWEPDRCQIPNQESVLLCAGCEGTRPRPVVDSSNAQLTHPHSLTEVDGVLYFSAHSSSLTAPCSRTARNTLYSAVVPGTPTVVVCPAVLSAAADSTDAPDYCENVHSLRATGSQLYFKANSKLDGFCHYKTAVWVHNSSGTFE